MSIGNNQSHTSLHSAALGSHEIQQQQIVSTSRNTETVVIRLSEGATVAACSQVQRLQRQQPSQRQCQQPAEQPFRNDFGYFLYGDRMQTYNNLFPDLCSYENLSLAFTKAKKGKSKKNYVERFELNLKQELYKLQWELMTGIYRPAALTTFIVRDPKTRKISASHFRDRVVHHAICNIIESIFESRFIYDSFANRKKKGTYGILKRFDKFMKKVPEGFALKADIRKYFDNIDQTILLNILRKRIKDDQLIDLISIILKNHKTEKIGKGMPLGNLTSQFFANIYLGELDNFIKHELRTKLYLRYVDDFIILSSNKKQLENWKTKIIIFLRDKLQLELHQDKTKIVNLDDGVPLVGFKVYHTHKILKRSNKRRFLRKLDQYKKDLASGIITEENIKLNLAGWKGYAQMANTYKLRTTIESSLFNR